jgi:hypothetical protein
MHAGMHAWTQRPAMRNAAHDHHAPTRACMHPEVLHPRHTLIHAAPLTPWIDAPPLFPVCRRSQAAPHESSSGGAHKGRKRQGSSSCHTGVSFHKASGSWRVQLYDPRTKRHQHVGCFASEEDAARAYDCAAVQAHGPGAERNFPDEVISELPVSLGEEQKQRSSSRYIGVRWEKRRSSWDVQMRDPQAKRHCHIGSYASEEHAAQAYDYAAVQAHGPGVERNFPGENL